jgi:hypothetical protein
MVVKKVVFIVAAMGCGSGGERRDDPHCVL